MEATLTQVITAGLGVGAFITGIYVWVGKHTSNNKKHPCKDDIVFKDVCEERQKTNMQAHEHLREGIEKAIARSDEQHKELKTDVKSGFDSVLELIKKNGR